VGAEAKGDGQGMKGQGVPSLGGAQHTYLFGPGAVIDRGAMITGEEWTNKMTLRLARVLTVGDRP
jgi:hypothetical protein